MESNKVNWGVLKEIPEISINVFSKANQNGVCAYFLTHIDTEVVKDVLSLEFLTKLVECESGTFRLFLHHMSFDYLVKWSTHSEDKDFQIVSRILYRLQENGRIIFIDEGIPIFLEFGVETGSENGSIVPDEIGHDAILITPLSACWSQCWKFNDSRILFTGNCRLMLNDLINLKHLHNSNGSPKPISMLYIDTFYCIETVQELPAREEVTAKIFKMIKNGITENPRMRFQFWTKGGLGIEDHLSLVWRSVYTSFRGKIQARPISYSHDPNDDNRDQCFLSFHTPFEFDTYYIDEDGSLDEDDDEVYKIHLHCDMTERGEDDLQLYELNKFLYTVYEEPYKIHGIYASHLSRFELGRFINYLNVDSTHVRPLYENNDKGEASKIESLIKLTCDFVFEKEPKNLLQEKPTTFYDFTDWKEADSVSKKSQAKPKDTDVEGEIIVIPFNK